MKLRKRVDELQMGEMVKVKENSQSASWRGVGGLHDVRVHLKSLALSLKACCVTPVEGRGVRNGHLVS